MQTTRWGRLALALTCLALVAIAVPSLVAQRTAAPAGAWRAPRTPDGRPDLQGFWTNATATPLQRPPELKDKEFFTEEEAAEYERTALDRLLQAVPADDRLLAADLNYTYLDYHKVGESRRTSLIIDPPDGRLPALLPRAQKRAESRPPGSADGPETFDLDERCLLAVAFGTSNSSPPLVPNPFGLNFYQIVQTPEHVMILAELVHDARIIRMNGRHVPPNVRLWLGDSIGRWEGDTLVVDTTNFSDKTRFRGSAEGLHVVERFTRTDSNTISYRVTVEDADTWARPWTAEIPFKATDDHVLEFACHEANYSMANSLRGARAEEARSR